MSVEAQNLIQFIDQWHRNDPVASYHNLRINSTLKRLVRLADSGTGGGGGGGVVEITSDDFINATDAPLIALDGDEFALFYDELQRHLHIEDGEWAYLAGGGVKVLLTDFDALDTSSGKKHFVLYVK